MKIEKGVDVPKSSGRGRPSKYPFSEMEVGDSLMFDGEYRNVMYCQAYLAAMNYGCRNYDKKFAGRKVEGGVRIWRVK